MNSYYIYSDGMSDFELSPEHPYRPERSERTFELCDKYDLIDRDWISVVPPEPFSNELLLLFHEKNYLDILKNADKSEVTEETMRGGSAHQIIPSSMRCSISSIWYPGVPMWAHRRS